MLTIAPTTGVHSSHPDFVSNRVEADGDEAPITVPWREEKGILE